MWMPALKVYAAHQTLDCCPFGSVKVLALVLPLIHLVHFYWLQWFDGSFQA